MRKNGYVIIEGNIGVGKSTFGLALTRALERRAGRAEFLPEPDESNNPFLPLYYADPARYAYQMQAHLLSKRYAATQYAQWGAQAGRGWFVMDRSYFGDLCFARVQLHDGYFTRDEYESYVSLHHAMETNIHWPTAAVFLRAPAEECNARISRRMTEKAGRQCESAISLAYLKSLQSAIDDMEDFMDSKTCVYAADWGKSRTQEEVQTVAETLAAALLVDEPGDSGVFSPWGDAIFNGFA